MSAEFSNRFTRLHQQCLVVSQLAQGVHDRVEGFPTSGRPPGTTVDDKPIGRFRNFRVEIVHEHAHGGFLMPALATALHASRRADDSLPAHSFS